MAGCTITTNDIRNKIELFFEDKGDAFKITDASQLKELFDKIVSEFKDTKWCDGTKESILKLFKSEYLNEDYVDGILESDVEVLLSTSILDIIEEEELNDSIENNRNPASKILEPVYINKLELLVGKSRFLRTHVIKTLSSDIVKSIIFDPQKGVIVKRGLVNKNIAKLKNRLYKELKEFLSLLSDFSYKDQLEDLPDLIHDIRNEKVNDFWDRILTLSLKYFFGENFNGEVETIVDVANKIISSNNKDLLNAYKNFIILSPKIFDSIISEILGKNISIKSKYTSEVPISFNKYSLVDESTFHGINWANEENDETLSKISKIVELLLTTTLIIDYNSGRPTGEYLDSTQVLYFLDEVKNRVKNTDVKFAFDNFHLNPLKHLETIIKYCTNNNIAEVPISLRHIARTLWDTFFDRSNKKSLYSITLQTLTAIERDCGLIDHITSMINRQYRMHYMFYGSNDERTGYGVQEISPTNYGRYSGLIKSRIENNLNLNPDLFVIKEYDVKYSVDKFGKEHKENISFTINLQIGNKLIADEEGDVTRKVHGEERRYRKIEGGLRKLLFTFDAETGNLSITDVEDPSKKYNLSELVGELPGNFFDLYLDNPNLLIGPSNYNAIALLKLIDRLLRTDFLSGEKLVFEYFRSEVTNSDSIVEPMSNLLELVNNALSIIKLKLDFAELKKKDSKLKFNDFVTEALNLNSKELNLIYNFYDKTRLKLKITRLSAGVIRSLTNAVVIAEGDYFKGTVKGVDSNAIAKYRKSSLAARYESLINRLKKLSVYKYSILSKTDGLIRGVSVLNGAEYLGDFKLAKDFTPGEWNYSSFMYDFVSSVFTRDSKYYCLPVTYSDKTTFFKYALDLTRLKGVWLNGNLFKFEEGKQVKDLDNATLRKAVWLNRSLSYTAIYKKVLKNTWTIVNHWLADNDNDIEFLLGRLNQIRGNLSSDQIIRIENVINKLRSKAKLDTYEDLRGLMHLITINELNTLAGKHNIDASENLYFIKIGSALDTNVALHYMANVIFNATDISENESETYNKYIGTLLKRACGSMLKLDVNFNENDLETLERVFKDLYGDSSRWFFGDIFVLAKTKTGLNITTYEELQKYDYTDIEFNPLFEKYILVDMLSSFDLRLLLVGSEMLHPNKERPEILEKLHNRYDSNSDTLIDDMFDLVRLQVNLFDLSSAKRTVNIGATISAYTMNSRIGIPRVTRRAIMYDPKADVFGPLGKDKSIDAHDGGSQGLMLEMILRNLSLEGDKIEGTISKSIEIDYTSSGAQILDKYALHGMDNWKIRNSLGSKYNLLNLVRRMMSIRFFDESGNYHNLDELDKMPDNVKDYTLDLTVDYLGKKIKLSQFTDDNLYYYDNKTNKIYKIVDFQKGKWPTDYIIKRIEIGREGQEVSIELDVHVTVNCLYDLWLAFGGQYSMLKINGTLLYTDISWHILANYVNAVGKYIGEYNGSVPAEMPDLTNIWQPLKHKYIGVLDVKSAVKNGAHAINSVQKWEPVKRDYQYDENGEILLDENGEKILESDEEYLIRLELDLLYVKLDTSNSGELLDATHILEDGEIDVSLPTLVIAALENGGYSHNTTKSIYLALGQQALNKINDDVPTVLKIYLELDPLGSSSYPQFKSEAYEVLGIIGIKAAKGDKFGALRSVVEQVLDELKKHRSDHADDSIKLPLSDSSIFMKIVADYVSNINKVAIKHKLAGFAAVISPSYGMLLLYRLPEGNFTYTEIERKAITYFKNDKLIRDYPVLKKILLYLDKIFQNQKAKPIAYVTPGLNIVICDESGNPLSDESGSYIRYNTQKWEKYLELKTKYGTGGYTFKVDINTPSDLLPMICYWGSDSEGYSYYDIPFIRQIFELLESGKKLTKQLSRFVRDCVQNILNILHEGKYVPATTFEDSNLQNFETITIVDNKELADSLGLPTEIKVRRRNDNEKVVVKDAELMVPNQYAKRFGMSEYESLSRVLDLGEGYFKTKYHERHKIAEKTAYNVCLTKSNGEHIYIVLKDSFYFGKLSIINTSDDDYKRKKVKGKEDVLVRINENGESIYNAGHFDEDGNPVKTIEEYLSDDGNTVYVVNDVSDIKLFLSNFDDIRFNDKVDIGTSVKFAEFISKIEEPNRRVEKFQHMCGIITNIHALIKNSGIGRDVSELASKLKLEKRIETYNETVLQIIKTLLDGEIISEKEQDSVRKAIINYFLDTESRRGLLNKTISKADRTRLYNKLFSHIYRLIFARVSGPIINSWAKHKFAAFLKSLEYVAARIPAQTLLSFMKMLVVAFVPGKVNNAYVSHYLTWLLGSDYDIDKSYLMGHEFTSSGDYYVHSPLALTDSYENLKLSESIPIPNLDIEFKLDKSGIDISDYLRRLSNNEVNNLKVYIDILNIVKDGKVKFDKDLKEKGEATIKLLNDHNKYFTTKRYKLLLSILNNVATNGILDVISSVLNYRLSHTPITLGSKDDPGTPKGASVISTVGLDSNNMSLSLVTDRNELTTHNLVGRKVIGIAAIGAKLFFNMSYALNELIMNGTEEEFKQVMYRFKFNPIILVDGKPLLLDIVRHILPNINFYKLEEKKKLIYLLIEGLESGEYSKEDIRQMFADEFELQPDQALVISELLSAATDNAKELILSKINATDLTAGLYVHLLVLGYDFEDIAKYMTDVTVSGIVRLAEKQICLFNPTSSRSRNLLLNVANALLGDISIWRFLDYKEAKALFVTLGLTRTKDLKLGDVLEKYLQNCILSGIKLPTENIRNKDMLSLLNYVNSLVNLKTELASKLGGVKIVNDQIEFFSKLVKGSLETTLIGKVLSSNQGMKTNPTELLYWIHSVEDGVTDHLFDAKKIKQEIEKSKDKSERLSSNKYYTIAEAELIISDAEKFDIIYNFSFGKFMLGNEEYKQAAIAYYALVKENHNLLYIINNLPHVKHTLQIFASTNELFNATTAVYRVLGPMYTTMSRQKIQISVEKRTIMEGFILNLFIIQWLKLTSKVPAITLLEGDMYFDAKGIRRYVGENDSYTLDFSKLLDIATFKFYMENYIFRKLLQEKGDNEFVKNLIVDDGRKDRVTLDPINILMIRDLNLRSELKGNKQIKYEQILADFSKLGNYLIDGNNIIELFELYNLVVNLNKIGQNNLTKLIFDTMRVSNIKIDTLNGNDGWFKFISESLDYGAGITFDVKLLIQNLLYYISDKKNWRSKTEYDKDNKRYKVTAKYRNKTGDMVTYNYSADLEVAKDMANYFILDSPFSRLISDSYSEMFDIVNKKIDIEFLKDAYSKNIIKIAYYCE